MIFVTGPLFSGKQRCIMDLLGWSKEDFEKKAVRDVQDLAGKTIRDAQDLSKIPELLQELADELAHREVVIATEIGGGVVPVDPDERRNREAAGRLACLLADRADVVIRVLCGIPRILKEQGDGPFVSVPLSRATNSQ